MDSLSQIVLGAAVAAAIVPAAHRRAALLAGAALGTLPDLDSIPIALLTSDPIALMTMHRSFSHSLFVLPIVAGVIWWIFRRFQGRVAESPVRWFWAILFALITHPLLDAFTVYGTQLWWPLAPHPTMGSSVFIIDPLYTIWLAIACVIAWFWRDRVFAQRALIAGLTLSSGYLGWSQYAKHEVDAAAQRSLAAMGLTDAPRFSVPMPFNTLLWRVVAMTPQGYVEAEYSVAADRAMKFRSYSSDVEALREAGDIAAVRQLNWFNRGFMRAQVQGDRLVLSDLRMGMEPYYNFRFEVARRDEAGWQPSAVVQQPWAMPISGWNGMKAISGAIWQRIWTVSEVPLSQRIAPVATPARNASTSTPLADGVPTLDDGARTTH